MNGNPAIRKYSSRGGISWLRRAFSLAPPRFQNSPPQVQNALGGLHPPFPPPLVTDAYA
ncbi:MAG: hypothetical protein LBC53_05085 [Spirochaetaceae bacterium]|nr:hypothetical protein [Spirochaetaceae bacterium]